MENREGIMNKKGLCTTCINDKGCCFPRKTVVWYCKEFSIGGAKSAKRIYKKTKFHKG